MIGLSARENQLLSIWNRMTPEARQNALSVYDRMQGDEPELMGIFPLLAALVPVAKKAFSLGKKAVGLIKKKPAAVPEPTPKTTTGKKLNIPPAALAIGGGLLLVILLTSSRR